MNASVLEPAAHPGRDAAARPLPHVDGARHRFVETSRLRVHVAEARARPQLVADSAVGFFERSARSVRGGSV